jgi:transcriptional activator for dhaKLM operon
MDRPFQAGREESNKAMTTQNEHVEQALTSFIDQSWHRCGKMMKREFWSTPHQAKG